MREDNHQTRRELNDFFSRARNAARQDKCMFCREKVSSLCKSHSIPNSFLKNIAVQGKVRNSYIFPQILELDLDVYTGVNKAGTFQLICRNCDNKIFQEYENPDNYNNPPTQKMMAQIAMKNYLLFISKRLIETEGHKDQDRSYSFMDVDDQLGTDALDLKWYKSCFITAKERILSSYSHKYHLIYYNKVDYTVPIATQIAIPIIYDFKGDVINDPYNPKSNYHLWDLHLCIFPFKNSSSIIVFVDENGLKKRYANFIQQFGELSDSDKLALINYLIFLYSEDMYLAPDIPKDVLENDNLKRVAEIGANTTVVKIGGKVIFGDDNRGLTPKKAEEYSLRKFKDIPNLLSYEYRV